MTDITSLIDTGFEALDREDYTAALSSFTSCVSEGLAPAASFNRNYGLALSYFGLYRQDADATALESARTHAEQAAAVYDRRYDLQLLLGQCYATQYQLTHEPSTREKAQRAYEMSRTHLPKTFEAEERAAFELKLDALLLELEGS